MRRNLSVYLFQIILWIFGYNVLGITVFLLMKPMEASIEPSLNFSFGTGILVNCICGIVTGLLNGTIDITLNKTIRRKTSFRNWILIKSALYIVFFLVFSLLTGTLIRAFNTQDINTSFRDTTSNSGLSIMFGYIFFSFCYMILVSFLTQVRPIFGKGVLSSLILGKYFKPRIEDRVFMFLDLKDSTRIAEQLGAFKYGKYIQDCFFDLDRSMQKNSGLIYKFVGDEVIISWNSDKSKYANDWYQLYFDFKQTLLKRQEYYLEHYDWVPIFKAGIHKGLVSVSEIGEQKKEIAFHGDVLNTAARIQGKCRELGANLLVSKQVLTEASPSDNLTVEARGKHMLKGKHEHIYLYAISIK